MNCSNDPTQNFFYKFIYLFIYLWLCWVFIAARGLSLAAASWGYSLLWCDGFSCCRAWALHAGFSSCGSQALQHTLSSCGSWAQLLHGMQDFPGPGLEPMSPALAGRFLTTALPGKSPNSVHFKISYEIQMHNQY